MSEDQHDLKKEAARNASNYIWPFYNYQASKFPANSLEQKIISDLVLPRISQIKHAIIVSKGNVIEDEAESFHFDQLLNISISTKIYETAIEKIISTYKKLGN